MIESSDTCLSRGTSCTTRRKRGRYSATDWSTTAIISGVTKWRKCGGGMVASRALDMGTPLKCQRPMTSIKHAIAYVIGRSRANRRASASPEGRCADETIIGGKIRR